MTRTTDTGGVRLIYNGEPVITTNNNEITYFCGDSPGHVGYYENTIDLSGSKYYGSSYTAEVVDLNEYDDYEGPEDILGAPYDTLYTLGNKTLITVDDSNAEVTINNIINNYPYVCETSSTLGPGCRIMYKIVGYAGGTNAIVYASTLPSLLGKSTKFNSNSDSLSDGGYMYGTRYPTSNITYDTESVVEQEYFHRSSWIEYWTSSSYTVSAGNFVLTNPARINGLHVSNWVGKYVCPGTSSTCSTLYYVNGYSGTNIDYVKLTNANVEKYLFGTGITDNGNGTFTFTGTVEEMLETDWYSSYSTKTNKYVCMPGYYTYSSGTYTCSDSGVSNVGALRYITSTTNIGFTATKIYKYGYGIEANGNSYRLIGNNNEQNTLQYIYNWPNGNTTGCFANGTTKVSNCGYKTISKSHYTCANLTGECDNYYYLHYGTASEGYAIFIPGGKYVSTNLSDQNNVLYEMTSINTEDSRAKKMIDKWYHDEMYDDYDEYIDDTIYCNNRTISDFGGFNPNNGDITKPLKFADYDNYSSVLDLTCERETDRFSVSNSAAKLNYKAGIAPSSEKTIYDYIVSNPWSYSSNVRMSDDLNADWPPDNSLGEDRAIYASISLASGIRYLSGTGTTSDPYVVNEGIHTLTYNANSGTGCTSTKNTFAGNPWGELCVPTRTNYYFGGWYTDTNYTTAVTSSTIPSANATVVAKWVSNPTARIGSAYYETLQDAIDAVATNNHKTEVVLLKNTAGQFLVAANQNIEFDLQTYTIAGSNSMETIINRGTIELHNGTITNDSENAINNYGIVTINGGTYAVSGSATMPALFNQTNATMTINSGTVTSNGIAVYNKVDGTVTISGGNLSNAASNLVRSYGTLYINTGANLTSSTNLPTVLNTVEGTLYFQGGTITSTTSNVVANYGVAIFSGGTITSAQTAYPAVVNQPDATLTINSGTITNTGSQALYNYGSTTINGGTLRSTNSVYETTTNLEDATLTMNGGSIIGAKTGIFNDVDATVILQGGSITSPSYFLVENDGTLLIHDGLNINTTSSYPLIMNTSTGVLNIDGGIIKNSASTIIQNNGGSATISGGLFENSSNDALYNRSGGTMTISGGTINGSGNAVLNIRDSTATITGGTFTSATDYALYNTGTMSVGNSANVVSTIASAAAYNGSGGILNIQGGTLTSSAANVVNNYGTLTISGGTSTSTSSSHPSIVNQANGTLNVTGGTISGTSNAIWNKQNGTANLSGGTLTSSTNALYNSGTMYIKTGFSLTVPSSTPVYNTSTGILYMQGGSLTNNGTNIINNYGTANISGGSMTSTASGYPPVVNQASATLNISGGTISGVSYAVWNKQDGTANLTGGTISSSNSYTLYNSGTMYLKSGLEMELVISKIVIYNGATGDLRVQGGVVLNGGSNTVSNYGTMTISSGVIQSTAGGSPAIINQADATLTITGGSVNGTSYAINNKTGATANISGGTLTSFASNTINNTGTVTISGTAKIESTGSDDMLDNGPSGVMYIQGGTIESTTAQGINNNGDLYISGGRIANGLDYALTNFGTATISGTAVLETTYYETIRNESIGTLYIQGGTLTNDDMNVLNNHGTATITGGTLTTGGTQATVFNQADGMLTIDGGTITNTSTGYAAYDNGTNAVYISGTCTPRNF